MNKVGTSVKVEEAQLGVLKNAARLAHEDYTEFMVNSAMLRIELRLLDRKPQSPMKAYEQLHLRAYDPKRVSPAVAKEIAELVAKDARGELEFEELGKIKVRPPSLVAARQGAVRASRAKSGAADPRTVAAPRKAGAKDVRDPAAAQAIIRRPREAFNAVQTKPV